MSETQTGGPSPAPPHADAPAHPDDASASRRAPDARSARRGLLAEHLRPTLKFLTVGGLVFLLDAALYNLLVFWHPLEGWGTGLLHAHPLPAKLLTIAVASCLTYLGNRLWTFGDRPTPPVRSSCSS